MSELKPFLNESEVERVAKTMGSTLDIYTPLVCRIRAPKELMHIKSIIKTDTGFIHKKIEYTGDLSFIYSDRYLYLVNNNKCFERVKYSCSLSKIEEFNKCFSEHMKIIIGTDLTVIEMPKFPTMKDNVKQIKIRKIEHDIKKYENLLKQKRTALENLMKIE
jgi:hypothetical protein